MVGGEGRCRKSGTCLNEGKHRPCQDAHHEGGNVEGLTGRQEFVRSLREVAQHPDEHRGNKRTKKRPGEKPAREATIELVLADFGSLGKLVAAFSSEAGRVAVEARRKCFLTVCSLLLHISRQVPNVRGMAGPLGQPRTRG